MTTSIDRLKDLLRKGPPDRWFAKLDLPADGKTLTTPGVSGRYVPGSTRVRRGHHITRTANPQQAPKADTTDRRAAPKPKARPKPKPRRREIKAEATPLTARERKVTPLGVERLRGMVIRETGRGGGSTRSAFPQPGQTVDIPKPTPRKVEKVLPKAKPKPKPSGRGSRRGFFGKEQLPTGGMDFEYKGPPAGAGAWRTTPPPTRRQVLAALDAGGALDKRGKSSTRADSAATKAAAARAFTASAAGKKTATSATSAEDKSHRHRKKYSDVPWPDEVEKGPPIGTHSNVQARGRVSARRMERHIDRHVPEVGGEAEYNRPARTEREVAKMRLMAPGGGGGVAGDPRRASSRVIQARTKAARTDFIKDHVKTTAKKWVKLGRVPGPGGSTLEHAEKGPPGSVGEIRDWKGGKHQKQSDGSWKPIKDSGKTQEGRKGYADTADRLEKKIKNGEIPAAHVEDAKYSVAENRAASRVFDASASKESNWQKIDAALRTAGFTPKRDTGRKKKAAEAATADAARGREKADAYATAMMAGEPAPIKFGDMRGGRHDGASKGPPAGSGPTRASADPPLDRARRAVGDFITSSKRLNRPKISSWSGRGKPPKGSKGERVRERQRVAVSHKQGIDEFEARRRAAGPKHSGTPKSARSFVETVATRGLDHIVRRATAVDAERTAKRMESRGEKKSAASYRKLWQTEKYGTSDGRGTGVKWEGSTDQLRQARRRKLKEGSRHAPYRPKRDRHSKGLSGLNDLIKGTVMIHDPMSSLGRLEQLTKGGDTPGTVHTWANGERRQKQADGTWKLLTDGKKQAAAPRRPETAATLLSLAPADAGGKKKDFGIVSEAEVHATASLVGGVDYNDELKAYVPRDAKKAEGFWSRGRNAVARVLDRHGASTDHAALKDAKGWQNEVKSSEDLAQIAEDSKESWVNLLRGIANTVGGEANFGPGDRFATKGLKGVKKKIEVEKRAKLEDLNDALRGTIILDSPQELAHGIATVKRRFKELGIPIAIDSKFDQDYETGYVGVHANVHYTSPSGQKIISELQFHLRSVNNGTLDSPKEQAHKMYKDAPKVPGSALASMLIFSIAMGRAL